MDGHIQYASTRDGVRIAYVSRGGGWPLVYMSGMRSNIGRERQLGRRDVLDSLSTSYQLVRYDGRGFGLSDRDPADVSLASLTLDLEAVLDALRLEKVALYAPNHAGPVAMSFAAEHPERLSHLILMNSYAKASDYFDTPLMKTMLPVAERDWRLFTILVSRARLNWSPSRDAARSATLLRETMAPEFFLRWVRNQMSLDVGKSLAKIHVPTLVIHRPSTTPLDQSTSGSIASGIADALLTIIDSRDGASDLSADRVVSEVRRFVSFPIPDRDAPADGAYEAVSLSRRELQILRLLALGYHNSDIAGDLAISVHTVERHTANIYSKLGIHGRVEAALYAFKQGLLQ
jgi:pimeloyl-ACP methyl ester carboxylesterase/DNA-binding CsgD family transcriptional regulator